MKKAQHQLLPRSFYTYLLFLMVTFQVLSCKEPEIQLDRAARRTVDTLFNAQIDSISPVLDSLCLANKEKLIQMTADSILKIRRKEEERLRLNVGETKR